MYAIVEIAGQQFKVEEGKKIFVHHMDAAEGVNVEFEKVLLTENEGVVNVGEPFVENAVVGGKVLAHVRGDKVIIFKKKRRKGYQKRTGHRQDFTQVEILSIGPKGAPRKQAATKAVKKEPVAPVAEEVKEEVKKAPAAKKTAPKKETAETKKPAVKKSTAKKAPAAKATKKPAKE
jgi:large subunit ribosomal protein L21